LNVYGGKNQAENEASFFTRERIQRPELAYTIVQNIAKSPLSEIKDFDSPQGEWELEGESKISALLKEIATIKATAFYKSFCSAKMAVRSIRNHRRRENYANTHDPPRRKKTTRRTHPP
jgi:hypothetical protein